jgi:nucleotide-binding universal stress UspA family protein
MAFIHVLVPTDFSAVAEHALHYGIEEATVPGAKMTLLHVMPSHTHAKVYYVSGAPDVRMGYDPALGGITRSAPVDPDYGALRASRSSAHALA